MHRFGLWLRRGREGGAQQERELRADLFVDWFIASKLPAVAWAVVLCEGRKFSHPWHNRSVMRPPNTAHTVHAACWVAYLAAALLPTAGQTHYCLPVCPCDTGLWCIVHKHR